VSSVRFSLALALLLVSLPWANFAHQPEVLEKGQSSSFSNDIWNETPFRNVAIPETFTFLNYIDYSDVGVLINNNSQASKTIGYAFVAARNISTNRVFLFDNDSTPTAETINPTQFDTYFAEPLRQMINDRNLTTELNYLVTTKGIPLRIDGPGNGKAAFDSEIGLVNGAFNSTIHQNWWASHTYGPGADEEMKQFSRQEEGFYLVTRLTGYTVDTALGLIDKANNSFGQRGQGVLDLATNRNGSGYKWWNDLLYAANTTLNGSMEIPVHFNQNSTFVTNESNVMLYASWGSNDGSWNENWLPNSGFDTANSAWGTESKYWDSTNPPLSADEGFTWARQTAVKRDGNAALEGELTSAACSMVEASVAPGLRAEYFDNVGITFNTSLMPDLSGRTADYWRIDTDINYPETTGYWSGLDSRFNDYWSARHTGAITIPETGNWTFFLNSDDGSKLWIDGAEVVNNEGVHGMRERSGTVYLSAGAHSLRTEFFEHGGWAGLIFSWQGVNQTKQVVPASAFTRGDGIEPAQNELIHHWSFDDGSGTVVADSAGSANMTLFNSNNGSAWQQCLFGNCYNFDGTNDYAKVDVSDWGGNFSISLWVNTANDSQDQFSSAFAVNDIAGDSASFQIMTSGASPGDWQVYHNISYPFGEVRADEWTHLVVTYQNATLNQYLDGELVQTTQVPNGTIDSIELYKVGVNRAGSTYFEGLVDELKVWNRTLTDSEVKAIFQMAAIICPSYSGAGNAETSVHQDYDFGDELKGHAWIVYGYGMKAGWLQGDYRLEVDSFDANGTFLVTNTSSTQTLDSAWNSRTMRFRPPANASSFKVKMIASLENVTTNGSVYFDTMNLRAIRPNFEWVDGSIAETAVSTGGRTFAWEATYGQSLVVDLLEDGVSGVKGYVYEPYLSAIGYPNLLLPYYAYGYNFAEVNYAASPLISWMGTVVGDPKMAPYSDILHDIDIEAVRVDGRLTTGVNGSIDVLVQNLAPGTVNGTLEVRERNGNTILANMTIQMPGGNDIGSRRIISVNLTPTRIGFNEYVIRYVASDWKNPERVVDNNLGVLNTQVNEPPTINNLVCSSWTASRGDTVGCTTTVSDDFGVVQSRLGWRLNGSGDNWTFINSTSVDYIAWYSGLTIPTNIELGTLDLIAEVKDGQFQYTLLQLDNAIGVTNALHNWFGVHIAGVDAVDWNGVSTLSPFTGPNTVVRDTNILLKACVVDADHDPLTELPMIITNSGNVSGVEPTDSEFSDVFCYQATWRLDWGSETSDVTVYLYDSIGNLFTTRSVSVHDEEFIANLTLVDFEGDFLTLARGTGERIVISLSDSDDLLSDYTYNITVEWPGHSEYTQHGEINAAEMIRQNTSVTLPPPEAGLVFGELIVTLEITDITLNGEIQVVEMNWTMHLQPPLVYDIGFCEGQELRLTRGEEVRGWVMIDPNRLIEGASVNLAQSGNIKPMQSSKWDWDDCQFPDSADYHWGFIILADNSFTAGGATLQIIARDIDGLSAVGEFTVEIEYGLPKIVNQSGEVTEGEFGQLEAIVHDSDGHLDTVCTFIIIDTNGTTVMESEGPLSDAGTFIARWMPPTGGAPFASTIGCTDAQGHQVAHTRHGIIPVPIIQNETGEGDVLNQSSDSQESNINLVMGVRLALLIISILGITLLGMWLRPPDADIDEDELSDEEMVGWAAPADSRAEGEQNIAIAEMAMESLSDVSESENELEGVEEVLNSETIEEDDSELDLVDENSLFSASDEPKD